MIIKGKLKSYELEHNLYKGESYMRAFLLFEIILLGVFKYDKIVFYDVTMFDDFREHIEHWNKIIKDKNIIPYSEIKTRCIFD